MLKIGEEVPDFVAESTRGTISFHDWVGDDWALLLAHPADFTPVCTTELGQASRLHEEFDKRGVKIVGLSVDGLEEHLVWVFDINRALNTALRFPILADPSRKIADTFDLMTTFGPKQVTSRAHVLVAPDKTVVHIAYYPMFVGRDFGEVLRIIDAAQTTWQYPVATPANWRQGDPVIVIGDDTEKQLSLFPDGVEEVLPYLKLGKLR